MITYSIIFLLLGLVLLIIGGDLLVRGAVSFANIFVEEAGKWMPGNPEEKDTRLGPLTRAAQIEVLEAQVRDAVGYATPIRCADLYAHHILQELGIYL